MSGIPVEMGVLVSHGCHTAAPLRWPRGRTATKEPTITLQKRWWWWESVVTAGSRQLSRARLLGIETCHPSMKQAGRRGAGKDSGRRVSHNGQGKGAAFPPCHPIFYGAHGCVKCREGWLAMGSPVCIAAPPPRRESEDNRLLPAICTSCSPRGAMQPLPQRRWGAPMPAGHPPVGGW